MVSVERGRSIAWIRWADHLAAVARFDGSFSIVRGARFPARVLDVVAAEAARMRDEYQAERQAILARFDERIDMPITYTVAAQ